MAKEKSWHDVIVACIKCDNTWSAYWGNDYNLDEVSTGCSKCGDLLEGIKLYGSQTD